MTQDAQQSLTDVAALMRERHKFEAWLAALEARRGSTPEHVFERVRADYEARLDRVMSDLLAHRDALEERVRDLGDRLAALEASERQRRDQRAEMELRAAVGELIEDDYAQAAREVEEAISRALAEKGEVSASLEETNELLLAVTMPKAMSPIAGAPAVGRKPEAASELEPPRITAARHASSAVPQPRDPVAPPVAAAAPAAPIAPAAAAPAQAANGAAPSPNAVPRPRPSAPVRIDDVARAEHGALAAAQRPDQPMAPEVAPAGEPMVEHPPLAADGAPAPRAAAASNAFDELAFLNSIVGEERKSAARAIPPTAPPPQAVHPTGPGPNELGLMREDSMGADSLRASRATGIRPDMTGGIVQEENISASLVSRADQPHDELDQIGEPLASNVTGNHPIVLRPAGDVAQHKTLRCNECGAMNYPTEWYCERCGAELAAL